MSHKLFVESDRVSKETAKRRKILFIVVGTLVLIVLIGAVSLTTEPGRNWLSRIGVLRSEQKNSDENQESQPTNQFNADASNKRASGDTQGAVEMYKAEIEKTDDNDAKAERLLELAVLVRDNGDVPEAALQEALVYALEADKLNPTPSSAATISLIYRDIGDEEQAQKYITLRDERNAENGLSGVKRGS